MRGIWLALLMLLSATGVFAGEAGSESPVVTTPPPPLPDYTRYTICQTFWLPEVQTPVAAAPTGTPGTAGPQGGPPPPPNQPSQQPYVSTHQPAPNIFVQSFTQIIHLSADGRWLLTVGLQDTVARVWDLQKGVLAYTLRIGTARIYDAQIAADGSQVLTASDDGVITLWDVQLESVVKTVFTGLENKLYFIGAKQMATFHQGSWVQGQFESVVNLYALPTLTVLETWGHVEAYDCRPEAVSMAVLADDGSRAVYVFDGQSPKALKAADLKNDAWQLTSPVRVLRRAPDGGRFLMGLSNSRQWLQKTRTEFKAAPFDCSGAGYSPCGQYTLTYRPSLNFNSWGNYSAQQPKFTLYKGDNLDWVDNWDANAIATWSFSADDRVLGFSSPQGVELRSTAPNRHLADLVSARESPAAFKLLFPVNSDRMLACFEDRVESWGPELDPLPHETDRAWTVYMDQLGLKHSLFTAAVYDSPQEIAALAQAHPDWIAQVDDNGATPLLYAAVAGRIDAVEALLKLGIDPNRADATGVLPMRWAYQDGNLPMLQLLEQYGAQVPYDWGKDIYNQQMMAPVTGRRYARIQLQTPPPKTNYYQMIDWLADHDLGGDPRLMAGAIHRLEGWNPALAQKVYNRYQRIPIYWLALMQLLLAAVAGIRLFRQRRAANDATQQQAQRESLRIRVYHESAWGDDAKGQLGLYPEEQRHLAELRHKRDGVMAAPLPMLLAYMSVIGVAAVIPYWWRPDLITMNTILLFALGVSWVFGHLQSTRMRIFMHVVGLLAAVVGCVYGLLVALLLPGIFDLWARWVYVVAGLAGLPLAWLLSGNLRLLQRIVKMEDQLASVVVHSNEEVKSDSGWDEKHPEVF